MRKSYFHAKDDAKRVSLAHLWLVFGSVLLLTVLAVALAFHGLGSMGDPIWPGHYRTIHFAVLHYL